MAMVLTGRRMFRH